MERITLGFDDGELYIQWIWMRGGGESRCSDSQAYEIGLSQYSVEGGCVGITSVDSQAVESDQICSLSSSPAPKFDTKMCVVCNAIQFH